ncbi:RHS repeat-associated core domain-containing protein [Ligaoa zhengdingensis]|uniref:RHS repeat-associated core domain-containing protein n=1 Tax=Ligaoa zhengdingensis TaxID=2763658 RepID=UPI003CCE78C8
MVQLTDATGTVTQEYEYDAFGNEQNPSANDTNPLRYCGEYFDAETGTIYLRARYYDLRIGRFTSADSFLGNANDPLSLNRYTYCKNNPILYIDPSGNLTYNLGKGWTARIENSHVENGKGKHIHLIYKLYNYLHSIKIIMGSSSNRKLLEHKIGYPPKC